MNKEKTKRERLSKFDDSQELSLSSSKRLPREEKNDDKD
jgi:hypothetical protein